MASVYNIECTIRYLQMTNKRHNFKSDKVLQYEFFFSLTSATVNCSETTREQIKKTPKSKNIYCSQYFTKKSILITSSQYFYLHFVHRFPLMFLLNLNLSLLIDKFYCSFILVYCLRKRFHNSQLCETFI